MENKLTPAEALGALSANENGLIPLKPVAIVEGKKYTLFNEESGKQITNNIKIRSNNIDKYSYVLADEASSDEQKLEQSAENAENTEEVQGTESAKEKRVIDALEDIAHGEEPTSKEQPGAETSEGKETVPETTVSAEHPQQQVSAATQEKAQEKLRELEISADLTSSVRSYFRTFVGINPEQVANNVDQIKKKLGGLGYLSATGYYIGTHVAAAIAAQAKVDSVLDDIKTNEDLFNYMLEINKDSGQIRALPAIIKAYENMGFSRKAAHRLAEEWLGLLEETNAWGLMAAVQASGGSTRGFYNLVGTFFHLKDSRVPTAKLLTKDEIEKKLSELETPLAVIESNKADANKVLERFSTEIEESEAVESNLSNASPKETFTRELVTPLAKVVAKNLEANDLTSLDTTMAAAGAISYLPPTSGSKVPRAVFTPEALSSSVSYFAHRLHRAYGIDHLRKLRDSSETKLTKILNNLDFIRENVADMYADEIQEDGKVGGHIISDLLRFAFNSEYYKSPNEIGKAQQALATFGLLSFAAKQGLNINEPWDEGTLAKAKDYIKNNYDIANTFDLYMADFDGYSAADFLEKSIETAATYAHTYYNLDYVNDITATDFDYFKNAITAALADTGSTLQVPQNAAEIVENVVDGLTPDEEKEKAKEGIKELLEEAPQSAVEHSDTENGAPEPEKAQQEQPQQEQPQTQKQQPEKAKAQQIEEKAKEIKDLATGLEISSDSPIDDLLDGNSISLTVPKEGSFEFKYDVDTGILTAINKETGKSAPLSESDSEDVMNTLIDLATEDNPIDKLGLGVVIANKVHDYLMDVDENVVNAVQNVVSATAQQKESAEEEKPPVQRRKGLVTVNDPTAILEQLIESGNAANEIAEEPAEGVEESGSEARDILEEATKTDNLETTPGVAEEIHNENEEPTNEETVSGTPKEAETPTTEPVQEQIQEELPTKHEVETEQQEKAAIPLSEENAATKPEVVTPEDFSSTVTAAAGKDISTLDASEVSQLIQNDDFINKFGQSEPMKAAVQAGAQLGLPVHLASNLALGNLATAILQHNDSVRTNQVKLPKNRKNIVVPRLTQSAGKPEIVVDKINAKTGTLSGRQRLTPTKENLEKVKKYIEQLSKYFPIYRDLTDKVSSNTKVLSGLTKHHRQGSISRLDNIAQEVLTTLDNNLGMDKDEVRRDATQGRFPLTRAIVDKYKPHNLYLPMRIFSPESTNGSVFTARTPSGKKISADTYKEALQKFMAALKNDAKEGKYSPKFVEALEKAYQKDLELQDKYAGKVPEDEVYNVSKEFGTDLERTRQFIRDNLNLRLNEVKEPPTNYITKRIAQTVDNFVDRLRHDWGIRDIPRIEDTSAATKADIDRVADALDKYVPGLKQMLDVSYKDLYEYAQEKQGLWEEFNEEKKRAQEVAPAKKEANDIYTNIYKLANKPLTAKTALKRIQTDLQKVDDILKNKVEKLQPGAYDQAKTFTRDNLAPALEEYGIQIPPAEDIHSFVDLAPYMAVYVSNKRKQEKGSGFKRIENIIDSLQSKKAETSVSKQNKPEITKQKETEKKAASKPSKQKSESQTKAPQTQEKPEEEKQIEKIPSKSNLTAAINTVAAKYVNAPKPPTEGRVKQALRTQFSKMLGLPRKASIPDSAAKKLATELGLDNAQTTDELLNTLAEQIINEYDKKQSTELHAAAEKAKTTKDTAELKSGFKASDIKHGLANFIENYPIPPAAIEKLLKKYGKDFSSWKPKALDELQNALRKLAKNAPSLGESIQEYFPKGFIIEPVEEQHQDNSEQVEDETVEGPTEEDLQNLEEEI